MKPDDPMPPGEWRALKLVFAHVTKVFGDDYAAAVKEINRELANGRVRAMVRTLADGKEHELPVEFWQTHKANSGGPGHITVPSKEYPSQEYRFFLQQKVWPIDNEAITEAVTEARPPWPRKGSPAGAKGDYDWPKILLEAVSYMLDNSLPKSLTELCNHIENRFGDDAPGETALKNQLRPFYQVFKKANAK
jgi:hypothetical protein